MRMLFSSDFLLRFAGGFALGALGLVGLQWGTVTSNLAAFAQQLV